VTVIIDAQSRHCRWQVFASFLSTFGLNLQKFSHLQNDRHKDVKGDSIDSKPVHHQFLWVAGPKLHRLRTVSCALAP
jgi:hypothetical protein